MLDDQEALPRQFQNRDEHATADAVEQDVAHRAAARTRRGFLRSMAFCNLFNRVSCFLASVIQPYTNLATAFFARSLSFPGPPIAFYVSFLSDVGPSRISQSATAKRQRQASDELIFRRVFRQF